MKPLKESQSKVAQGQIVTFRQGESNMMIERSPDPRQQFRDEIKKVA